MKKLATILFFLGSITGYSQDKVVDSLYHVLKSPKDDIAKIKALIGLSVAFENEKPDSAILCLEQSLKPARNVEDKERGYKFEFYALSRLGALFGSISNYPKGLEFYIESLKLAESKANSRDLVTAYSNIAYILEREKEYGKALAYYQIADSIITASDSLADFRDISLGNFGNIYYKLNNLDSALYLTMQAYELSKEIKGKENYTGIWLNNLGNIYSKKGNLPAAMKNYEEAILYSEMASDMDNICESSLGLAKIFEQLGNNDSALAYANKVLALAAEVDFESRKLQASEFLKDYYKKAMVYDSAFKYQELMITIKDSINSNERIKASLNITIEEELRQHEKREELEKEREERNKTLQLLGAGMLIPSFFLFTIFIRRRKIKPQIIKFCGVASLLMLFECITLLLHPYVVHLSNHIVIFELLIFVCIAAIVIPTHHKIEHWLLSKLTAHKNAAHQK